MVGLLVIGVATLVALLLGPRRMRRVLIGALAVVGLTVVLYAGSGAWDCRADTCQPFDRFATIALSVSVVGVLALDVLAAVLLVRRHWRRRPPRQEEHQCP
jgi:hypothetical protein